MRYLSIGPHMPRVLRNALFGDRERHGLVPQTSDPDWMRWREVDLAFYDENQRQSFGSTVNASGHKIMSQIGLDGLDVMEIGPGSLDHMAYWNGKPKSFRAVDVNAHFLERAMARLKAAGVPSEAIVTSHDAGGRLPFVDASCDLVLSFYSLEHLHPLESYLNEIDRVLKPGGRLVGAIPCEGGIGWGLGRYLTTRRWLLAHGVEDPGKIISWEHPNFADQILDALAARFRMDLTDLWPLMLPVIDMNLIARFIARKAGEAGAAVREH